LTTRFPSDDSGVVSFSLSSIARALGAGVTAGAVLAPGPGHGLRDRSLSVKISVGSPDGFIVCSFAGDDWRVCRDYVKSRLGLSTFEPAPREPKPAAGGDGEQRRIERAVCIWNEARNPRGTVAEKYLRSRALQLDDDVASVALRFHPRCPWRDDAGETIFVPAMVAAMRSVVNDHITAIHRTRLSPEGVKIDRRMLGIAAGAAIKLDADNAVTNGLTIGEGVETCLSARQFGLRPAWALASAGAIGSFPAIAGVDCLTLLAEHDAASAKAVQACAERWHAAGREVIIIRSTIGSDLNDALRGAA
jgi:putative DNA primase/helicase